MIVRWRLSLAIILSFFAAIAGVLIGNRLVTKHPAAGVELHDVLHDRLDLDESQRARLDVLERRYAVRRKAVELELRADNALLAEAIEAEHGYGPQVSAAIDRSHHAMGRLQKETLAHVFMMRRLLRPDQTVTFDRAVTKALTADGR